MRWAPLPRRAAQRAGWPGWAAPRARCPGTGRRRRSQWRPAAPAQHARAGLSTAASRVWAAGRTASLRRASLRALPALGRATGQEALCDGPSWSGPGDSRRAQRAAREHAPPRPPLPAAPALRQAERFMSCCGYHRRGERQRTCRSASMRCAVAGANRSALYSRRPARLPPAWPSTR